MAKTGKKENKVRLFNINGHEGQETQHNIIVANSYLNIPTRELKYNIQNSKLNKDNIIIEILHEVKQGETPILNIQYNSNMEKPIVDINDLAALKKELPEEYINSTVEVALEFSMPRESGEVEGVNSSADAPSESSEKS